MNAKLIVEGKEFDIEILDPNLQKLIAQPKKTGYERVEHGKKYWRIDNWNEVYELAEDSVSFDCNTYVAANYYSDKTVAENNVRADTLMRQLRRFAVEYRKAPLVWDVYDDNYEEYWTIYYNTEDEAIDISSESSQSFGTIYFDRRETARLAIDKFNDELKWYFTEYKDSL